MDPRKPQQDISILIPSCDKYSDVRDTLLQGYVKFWVDCPYEKYIITNGLKTPPSEFINIDVGDDIDRSTNCINAIDQIDSQYILMHIDDLILSSKVNGEIEKYIDIFLKDNGNYLQLLNLRGGTYDQIIYEKGLDEPYRTSTIFSLWKKEVLLDLLKRGDNPRQFEIEGTSRSKKYDKRYFLSHNYFSFENLIIKGQINTFVLKKLNRLGIDYSGNRARMTQRKHVAYFMKCLVFDLILFLPTNISEYLVKLARKIG